MPRLELVWTSKEAGLRPGRDTAVVVRELFARAEKTVLIGGFRFDHGQEILAPLHQAMAERGVDVEIFRRHSEEPSRGRIPTGSRRRRSNGFYARNWPFGPPRPDLCYDPETVVPGAPTSLHAKCLVVDTRVALVSSANFTERGLTRNLEAGVIEDTTFARRLSEQWLALVDTGQMKPYRP